MRTILIEIFLILVFYSCKKDEGQDPINAEYQFITSHNLTQKTDSVDGHFYLKGQYDLAKFDNVGHYEIIFKSSGVYYGLLSDTFKLVTIRGTYNYNKETNRISFLGKDSIIIKPGDYHKYPEGGVFYLIKADWLITKLNDSTLKVNAEPQINIAKNEILVLDGLFYLKPK